MANSQITPTSNIKIFNGVRFVLFGFDPNSESQYRSEFEDEGGVDVGKYDPSCTHVIVSNRVYDDPVCVVARKDGKVVVTELWVDDSVDFGRMADANQVLYKPVKDLNGIPGSKSLFVCLTGYQRQERENIMKMVSLMGARFTKPLIASQVTHLICYKFEGEKYELAKKVKINLVNHRWLEDCLKAWEILPIDNYTKSGYELELLEAEARDSEEETEDPSIELLRQKNTACNEMPRPADSHMNSPDKEMSRICQETSTTTAPHILENPVANQRFSTPCREANHIRSLDKPTPNLENNDEISNEEAGSITHTGGSYHNQNASKGDELSIPPDANLQKKGNTLSYMRHTTLSYSRKNSTKAVRKEGPSDFSKGDPNISLGDARTNCKPDHCEHPKDSSALPEKRKASDLSLGSKSPKLDGQRSNISMQSPSMSILYAELEPTAATSVNHSHADASIFSKSLASNSKENEHAVPSKFKSLSYKRRSIKHGQSVSSTKILKSADSPSSQRVQFAQQQQPLPVFETKSSVAMFSPDLDPKQAIGTDGSLGNATTILKSLAIDGSSTDMSLLKDKAPKTSVDSGELEFAAKFENGGDIEMNDISNETEQPQRIQKDGRNASLVTRDPETRNLSCSASNSKCKGKGKMRKKKVVSRRNLSCEPQVQAGNANEGKDSEEAITPKYDEPNSEKLRELKAVENYKKATNNKNRLGLVSDSKLPLSKSSSRSNDVVQMDKSLYSEKENKSRENCIMAPKVNSHPNGEVLSKDSYSQLKSDKDQMSNCAVVVKSEPACFILCGHRFQRKEFQTVIRRLRGKVCRDSHNWSYQATHFIVPDPVRRTEKFFAAAAAGRWILKKDYLTASSEAGIFLDEEPFEWYGNGLTEDGAISLEAPRKWRHLRERTGHGAFQGMRIIIYGECIAPTLDTLKRVVKAGGGTILATSPPYTRFLKTAVDYAVVCRGMPRVDSWVQEFFKHEIPCVLADYLVDYVCKPGFSMERHVLYNMHKWAEKSFANLLTRSEEIVSDDMESSD